MYADLLLTGGTIRSAHTRWRPATHLALGGGRVLAVGNRADVEPVINSDTRTLDLQGGTAVPGLVDAHLHLLGYGLTKTRLALQDLPSLAAAMAALQDWAERQPGAWILGRGFDQDRWAEGRLPTRHDLDAVVADRPVFLQRNCNHIAVVNSRALELAGITAATEAPPGGHIDRDEHGVPTGVLREDAVDLIKQIIPPLTREQKRDALVAAAQEALSLGITGVHTDDVLSAGGLTEALDLFGRVMGPEGLPLRITMLLPQRHVAEAVAAGLAPWSAVVAAGGASPTPGRTPVGTGGYGAGAEWLRFGAVKIFADGSLGGRTAALRAPYSDDPTTSGLYIHSEDALDQMVARAHSLGWQVSVHAIGDGAAERLLNAVHRAQQADPKPNLRHRLIHAQIMAKDLIHRMAALGVVGDIQPVFLRSDGHWFASRVGAERARASYAWRDLLDAGVTCCGGSDCPIEPLNPLLGIYTAVVRRDFTGYPTGGWNMGQALSVAEALDLYTRGSAYAAFDEHWKGSLLPGMVADVTVLNRDPFATRPEELKDVQCTGTIVGGDVAYQA